MLKKMIKFVNKALKINMANEQELKDTSSLKKIPKPFRSRFQG